MGDGFDLERFTAAQDAHRTYATALQELRGGRKHSHWMWFVFPQLHGLGSSPTAQRYAIGSLAEAQAYAAHPVLGRRLAESAETLLALDGPPGPEAVFGPVDALKLRSSMTLFHRADPGQPLYGRVLDAYFGGQADAATDRLLAGS